MTNKYLRFLAHSADVTLPCDLTAIKLLEVIAACENHETLTVTEAMSMADIASPATIHRKLDDLRELGLVDQRYEGKNRRTKYLVTTAEAQGYFEKMSKAMELAAGSVA